MAPVSFILRCDSSVDCACGAPINMLQAEENIVWLQSNTIIIIIIIHSSLSLVEICLTNGTLQSFNWHSIQFQWPWKVKMIWIYDRSTTCVPHSSLYEYWISSQWLVSRNYNNTYFLLLTVAMEQTKLAMSHTARAIQIHRARELNHYNMQCTLHWLSHSSRFITYIVSHILPTVQPFPRSLWSCTSITMRW